MCGFYCMAFIKFMLTGKTLFHYTNLFSPNDYKKNDKIRTNMSNLEFILKKINETRKDLLEEIRHNDLINEKYKKTCKYLNYVEHLLILALTITSWVSIFAFA